MGRSRQYASATERQRAHRRRQRAAVLQQFPVVAGEGYTLYQGDAHTIAPTLQGIRALIADPPFGVRFNFMRYRRSRHPLQGSRAADHWAANILGDDRPFNPIPWLGYPQIILWGANHYASRLPDSPSWLIWDKRVGSTPDAFSDAEQAWTNLGGPIRIFSHKWRGIIREGEANVANRGKFHPAEKPIELMLWCVEKTTGTVLDPYMGSGTTGEACVRLGRPFVGIELDPHYFQVACERLETAARQGQLFAQRPQPLQQDTLFQVP